MKTLTQRAAARNSHNKNSGNTAMLSVYDGQRCVGFVLPRGKAGFEALDQDGRSCGIFTNQQDALAALSGPQDQGERK